MIMNNINDLIKAEIALARENMIFELLGEFGDRLPKDVQNEMRKKAESESQTQKKMEKRVVNNCKYER